MVSFKKIIFAILPLILLGACKKKEEEINFDFNIEVIDYYSSVPIENVTVKAYTKGINSGTYSSAYQLQASESTDNDGSCQFKVEYGGIEVIKISLEKNGYFSQNFEYNPDDFSTEEINDLKLPLKQKGIISIKIKNNSPISAADEINFNTLNSGCSECVKFNSLTLSGTNVDTTLTGTIVLNRYYKYQYIVTKNGNSNNYLDSAYCDNDTTFINISY